MAWTRGAAWAATLVLALGTGYLIRDLAGPEPLAEPDAAASAVDAESPAPATPPRTAGADEGSRAAQKTGTGREIAETEVAEAADPGAAEPIPQPAPTRADPAGTLAETDAAAEPAVRPGAGQAATGVASGRWTAATVEDASTTLGGPLYLLPRAELVEVYVGDDAESPSALSIQRLSSGVPVRVVQRRPPPVEAEAVEEDARTADAAEPVAPGDRALSLRAAGEGASRAAGPPAAAGSPGLPPPETAQVIVEGFVLELTASLPADLLAILGSAARPAPR